MMPRVVDDYVELREFGQNLLVQETDFGRLTSITAEYMDALADPAVPSGYGRCYVP